MSHLVPCPACSRHVRVTEPTCPFCGDGLALAGTPAPSLPKSRLGRAATFAFGATLVGVTTVVACGGDDTSSGGGSGGATTGTGGTSAGAAGSSSGTSGDATAGSAGSGGNGGGTVQDSGGLMALYGAAAGGGPVPVYGAAPAN